MNVIFLDVDGVINLCLERPQPDGSGEYRWSGLKRDRMANLNRIVNATGAVVVTSSSWKYSKTLEQINRMFREVGFIGQVIDFTPNLSGKRWRVRGYEILAWLVEHWDTVDGFCLIDDGPWTSGIKALEDRLVRLVSEDGLLDSYVERCVAALRLDWEPARYDH